MGEERRDSWADMGRNAIGNSRRHFMTRTATDDAAQLLRRSSVEELRQANQHTEPRSDSAQAHTTSYETRKRGSYGSFDNAKRQTSPNTSKGPGSRRATVQSLSAQASKGSDKVLVKGDPVSRPVSVSEKLGTFTGVFVPTSLNVFSILMFIRFGFVLGQGGVLGTFVMLIASYALNVLATLSISAVASNGTVRGGGAYYLISRSLGPEFGGSIGIISYLGFVFNTGMNAVGLIDCLTYNFGSKQGIWSNWLQQGGWWQYLWSSIVLLVCVAACLAGSSFFARAGNGLLIVLMVSIISIPISAVFKTPFKNPHHDKSGAHYTEFTGLSMATFKENLLPYLTHGAAGSQIKGKETFQDLFGILFPATGGIFAGASMSGDLKNPSKAIPRGTLYGIFVTFVFYAVVILSMAASITRKTLYRNVNVVQDINLSGVVILLGELSTCIFSVVMGIVGPAKQLQAIARDGIFPGLKIFGQGTAGADEPIVAILLTWALSQLTLFFNINAIASLVTMSYLLMSLSLHLACLLLKLSSAPNFRPSFHYFNQWTALAGAVLTVASMIFVDEVAAAISIIILMAIFLIIHYTTPPKPWGSDVTSGLVYHQIRKYLLRLKTEHVKYWRPQILLFVNDPRRGYKLVQFANSLKKGGLFILGHVIVTENFAASVPEVRRQQAAWTKYIEFMKIKSFVNVAISPSIEWGSRNILLSAGLGGMRPNIVMMGFYNLQQLRQEQPFIDMPSAPPERKHASSRRKSFGEARGSLPTDTCYVEKQTDMQSYILVLEDMILRLHMNVAVAVNFPALELPNLKEGNSRKYIDLWPIQMSAEISPDGEGNSQSLLTTNFDTYTMILQLGCILNTVPAWKKSFKLRVAVFVEYESDVEEERSRVESLLENLRIEAKVLVFWLACGDIRSYELIVNGNDVGDESEEQINKVLEGEIWWKELAQVRGKLRSGDLSAADVLSLADDARSTSLSFGRDGPVAGFEGLRRMLSESRYRPSFSRLSRFGVSLNMRTHRLDDDLLSRHTSRYDDSDYSHSDTEASHEADGGSHYLDFLSDDALEDDDSIEEDEAGDKDVNRSQNQALSSKKSSRASSRRSKGSKTQRKSPRRSILEERTSSGQLSRTTSYDDDADSELPGNRGRPLQRREQDVQDSSNLRPLGHGHKSGTSSRFARGHSPNFTSAPLPATKVLTEEGQGPSIMFADVPHPRRQAAGMEGGGESNIRSIYHRSTDDVVRTTPGFPSAAAVPLSFNDLPSRAQHLILNELMAQNSDDTAVIFTTLPAPEEGTYKSESASLTYLTDLEVLTGGLGPVLLVHSNSMTVTTNL